MNCVTWAKKMLPKMTLVDISLIKLSVLFFTLFLVTAWTGFRELVLSIAWFWHLIAALILTSIIFYRTSKK